MPTPNLYRNFAKQNIDNKWKYLGLCGMGLFCSLLAVLIMLLIKINLIPIFAIGVFLEFWGIALFAVIIGFEKKQKSKYRLVAFFRSIDDWVTALFLNFWLLLTAIMSIYIFGTSITKSIK